jgi:hypothetical protein
MPGLNRTGPRGIGPMTGGGRGLCNPGRIGTGYRGFGLGFQGGPLSRSHAGRGRGGYARRRYPGFVEGINFPTINRDQEIDELKNQAQVMLEQLTQVEERIKQVTKES